MCFGGGGSDDSSKQMVQMQQQEAEAARQKEAARQARIQSGLARISAAFEGAPIMGTRGTSYTAAAPGAGVASGAAVPGLPAGYTYVMQPGGGAAGAVRDPRLTAIANMPGGSNRGGGNARSSMSPGNSSMYGDTGGPAAGAGAGGAGGGGKWMVRGPDGRMYEVGSQIGGSESYDTGRRSGGINDAFFDRYKQGILDYYTPQVAEKYGDAKDELTYRLARAGTLRSSMAATETADLAKQNDLNMGKIRSQADTAAADLRSRVASERQKAESQLYATENPDVAANQATAAINNITAAQPDTTPLGDIFQLAAVGGANFLKGAANARGLASVPGYTGRGATRVVGA
jgi:hypothetical protein